MGVYGTKVSETKEYGYASILRISGRRDLYRGGDGRLNFCLKKLKEFC